ncbi:uncharacterized protein LOC126549393 [Aphis gossypii]|uniref:uncharacterized protein LOC126549393 n=1 Tax=Aphis gossypii TaxID=80765 RepID=UPI002159697F|nr:uncharacterized protein LOC126549393 [Aphis gossypii]
MIRFPLKNPNLLQHWSSLFTYRQPPGGTYILKLNSDAIPKVCLPSSPHPPVKFQKKPKNNDKSVKIQNSDETLEIQNNVEPLEIKNSDETLEIQNSDEPLEIQNSDDEITKGITPIILIIPTKYQSSSPIKITPTRKRKSIEITTPIRKMKSQIKVLQQKVQRQNVKIKNMSELFKEMKKKVLLDSEMECTITNKFDGIFLELFKNQLKNKKCKVEGQRYSDEIQKFAMTLNYYSPKAFNCCWSVLRMLLFCWRGFFYAYNLFSSCCYGQHMYLVFNIFFRSILKLPNSTAIRNWTSCINMEPGFFKEVFNSLSNLICEDKH